MKRHETLFKRAQFFLFQEDKHKQVVTCYCCSMLSGALHSGLLKLSSIDKLACLFHLQWTSDCMIVEYHYSMLRKKPSLFDSQRQQNLNLLFIFCNCSL